MPTIRALLFDLGGVVVSIDFRRAFQSWAQAAGADAARIAARFAFDTAYEAHERGEIDGAEYFDSLRCRLGLDLPDEAFRAGWNAIFLDPVPGMRDLLRSLPAALPLFLFSNTNRTHHDFWRVRYDDLLRPFSAVYCSHELGQRKPATAAFRAVAARMGHVPEEIAFFDDLEENVDGAKATGMQAFRVATPADVGKALAGLGIRERSRA